MSIGSTLRELGASVLPASREDKIATARRALDLLTQAQVYFANAQQLRETMRLSSNPDPETNQQIQDLLAKAKDLAQESQNLTRLSKSN